MSICSRIRPLFAFLAIGIAITMLPARANDYPQRPVKLIVPFAAGGDTDTLGRLLAKQLSDALAQPVIVENVTGAAGTLGTASVTRAPADGYTLLLGASVTNAIAPALYPQLRYDPVKDFAPIAQIATFGNPIVVAPSLPVHNIAELVRWAKQSKDGGAYGSWGIGSSGHLAMEMVNRQSGISMTHVPYKGTVLALNDVLAGQLSVAVTDPLVVAPFYKTGKVRVIAMTGSQRSSAMPDVPTLVEQGIPMSTDSWYAIFAPAKTPEPVQRKLRSALAQATASADFKKTLSDLGLMPASLSLADFDAVRRKDVVVWAQLVKLSGAKAE